MNINRLLQLVWICESYKGVEMTGKSRFKSVREMGKIYEGSNWVSSVVRETYGFFGRPNYV